MKSSKSAVVLQVSEAMDGSIRTSYVCDDFKRNGVGCVVRALLGGFSGAWISPVGRHEISTGKRVVHTMPTPAEAHQFKTALGRRYARKLAENLEAGPNRVLVAKLIPAGPSPSA